MESIRVGYLSTLYILIGILAAFGIVGMIYSTYHTFKTKAFISARVTFSKEQLFAQTVLGIVAAVLGFGLLCVLYVIFLYPRNDESGFLLVYTLPLVLPPASILLAIYFVIATATQRKFPRFALSFVIVTTILIFGTILKALLNF